MAVWFRRIIETLAPDVTHEVGSARCLVLAPHPDDEVLGCGGTIARKVRSGADVAIVFLTDGRHGVPVPPEQAIALRRDEAASAAAILGLPSDRVVFCGFEDKRLAEHIEEATACVRQIAAALGVRELFVPYRRDSHADHLAAWRIGASCIRPGMRMYEYPVWYGPWLWNRMRQWMQRAAVPAIVDAAHAVKVRITEVADVKQRALAAHRSQVTAFESQPWGPPFLGQFLGDYELFFCLGR